MADMQSDHRDQAQSTEPEFGIQRIYIKDISFETPNSPQIFLEEWKPEMNLDLGTKVNTIENDIHEVVLTVTVTVKNGDKVAFLAEVQHGGIFSLLNFEEEHKKQMLGAFCPNIIYPYAREVVTDLVTRGGFPQLYLTPVNFDALYAQHQEEEAKGDADSANDADASVH